MQIRLTHTLLMTTVFLALSLSSAFAIESNRIVNTKGTDKVYFVIKHEAEMLTVREINLTKMAQANLKFEELFNGVVETTKLDADDNYMGDEETMLDANAQQVALVAPQDGGITMRVLTLADPTVAPPQQMGDGAALPNDFHPDAEHQSVWAKILGCHCCGAGSSN